MVITNVSIRSVLIFPLLDNKFKQMASIYFGLKALASARLQPKRLFRYVDDTFTSGHMENRI